MERPVALMCWLLDCEQHLERRISGKLRGKHEVVGGESDL
jgi:hypothetical protein